MWKSFLVRFCLFVAWNIRTVVFSFFSFLVIVVQLIFMMYEYVLFLIAITTFILCSLWVLVLMYQRYLQCWRIFPFLHFLTHTDCLCHLCKAFCIVISFLVLQSICWTSSLVHFKNSPEYLKRVNYSGVNPVTKIAAAELYFDKFSRSSEKKFFALPRLAWLHPIQIFPITCNFILFQTF